MITKFLVFLVIMMLYEGLKVMIKVILKVILIFQKLSRPLLGPDMGEEAWCSAGSA